MAIINDTDTLVTYYYDVKSVNICFKNNDDGDSTNTKVLKPEQLKSLYILNDYMGNMFPVIQAKFSMSAKLYYRVIRNKDTVKFAFNIRKYYTKRSSEDKSLYEKYINKSFSLILDDDDEDLYSKVREKNNGANQSEEDLNEQAQEVEFYLFRSDLIKATKKNINKIFQESTITNAIAFILGKMKVHDMLMSKADNGTIYNPIIIPPMKYSEALKYLDTFYGIHKTGTLTYFGITRSYMVKFEGKCSAYEKNEIKDVVIIIPEAGSSTTQASCSVLKKGASKKYYLIADYDTVEFSNESVTDSLLNGNEVEIINTNSGKIETSASKTDDSKAIIENMGKNRYFKSIYKKLKAGLNKVITLDFDDIDLDALEPNKKFTFNFEDRSLSKKYKGTYILGKSEIALGRSGEDLHVTAHCTFYSDS